MGKYTNFNFSKNLLTIKHMFGIIILTNKCSQNKGGINMKIKNVKKFVRSILIILGIILVLSLVIAKASYSHGEKQYKSIYVSEGDTLWNIAKDNQKNNLYYKDKDIRYIINDLININKLNSSNIRVNQEILIPVV